MFETDNKLWNILFLMPIWCWEMLKEEFGVFGDTIKVSKVFVQKKLWLKAFYLKLYWGKSKCRKAAVSLFIKIPYSLTMNF